MDSLMHFPKPARIDLHVHSRYSEPSTEWFMHHSKIGWTPQTSKTASNILSLWGLGNLGSHGGDRSDVYALSMSYDGQGIRPRLLGTGEFGLAAQNKDGKWINAVDKNFGGQKRFVYGPWRSVYALGTYGVNPNTHTAWAVLDYDDDFAVAHFQVDTWD